jgi:hypothetical protein
MPANQPTRKWFLETVSKPVPLDGKKTSVPTKVTVPKGTTHVEITTSLVALRLKKKDPSVEVWDEKAQSMILAHAPIGEILFGAKLESFDAGNRKVEFNVYGNLETAVPGVKWSGAITVHVWCFAEATQAVE